MKLFTTQIDIDIYNRLKDLANNNNMKIKGLVNEAFEDLLKKYSEKENINGRESKEKSL